MPVKVISKAGAWIHSPGRFIKISFRGWRKNLREIFAMFVKDIALSEGVWGDVPMFGHIWSLLSCNEIKLTQLGMILKWKVEDFTCWWICNQLKKNFLEFIEVQPKNHANKLQNNLLSTFRLIKMNFNLLHSFIKYRLICYCGLDEGLNLSEPKSS